MILHSFILWPNYFWEILKRIVMWRSVISLYRHQRMSPILLISRSQLTGSLWSNTIIFVSCHSTWKMEFSLHFHGKKSDVIVSGTSAGPFPKHPSPHLHPNSLLWGGLYFSIIYRNRDQPLPKKLFTKLTKKKVYELEIFPFPSLKFHPSNSDGRGLERKEYHIKF